MPISFTNVFYTYSPKSPLAFAALKDINVTIEDHSFTALIGQTGSGKSTLVQHINGLLRQSEGTIDVNGFILEAGKKNKKIKELRKNVGLVFQFPEYQLFEETVLKDVMFGPKNFGVNEKEAREAAIDALSKVYIDKSLWDKSPFELSGGQKRRAAIAGILAMKPEVLILDEPTAGLDPKGRDDILDQIARLHKESKITVVLVSHSMEDVAKYVDRLIVMDDGKVRFDGTPREVFSHYKELEKLGLAAPQVGMLKRIVVIDIGDENGPYVLINPVIKETSGEQTGEEGCLSVPGKSGLVTRPNHVKVKALNEDMEEIELEGEGLLARAFCHEIDHLDGKMYVRLVEGELHDMQYEEEE